MSRGPTHGPQGSSQVSDKMNEFDVFVGNHAIINMDIYDLWLRGLTAEEAADALIPHSSEGFGGGASTGSQGRQSTPSQGSSFRGSAFFQGSAAGLVLADVLDHYRTLSILERFLQNPPNLVEQLNFQLTSETQQILIQKYYEYDATVFREFAGKKLSTRARNGLDEVCEKLGVRIKSSRRQFDNVKRVLKQVEDLDGSLLDNIQTNFLLPTQLASQYACMVFITNNRFELTGKRKLNYMTFGDITYCAHEMMTNWTSSQSEEGVADLDREFLMELRDLKVILERDSLEEHKTALLKNVKGRISVCSVADLEANFKNYSRALVNIAHGLNHSKEARDIFVDIVEKVIEPAKNSKWSSAELVVFINAYGSTVIGLTSIKNNSKLLSVVDRYLATMKLCIFRLYHN